MTEQFWPAINSPESAEKAIRRAAWFAVVQGAITLTMVFVAISIQEPIGGVGERNMIDVALIFLLLGVSLDVHSFGRLLRWSLNL